MASHNLLFLFFFFYLSFFYSAISQTSESDSTYLSHFCNPNKTFASNTPYQSHLTTLLSSLSSNATGTTEFYNTTAGDSTAAAAYGLFMCRGDVNSQLCHQCVVNATQRISSECQFSKEAVIWYDECMIRYSNRSFFSTVDTIPKVGLLNSGNVSDQANFMSLLFETMNATADEAAAELGKKKYATGKANISGFQSLYCLVQCTPDLSREDCRRCLSGVIGDFNWCCEGKQGGRVLYPSCNARYELYRFYQSDAVASSPSPTPDVLVPPATSGGSQGEDGISSGTIIAIVVPITMAVLLIIAGICFLSKRTRKRKGSRPEGTSISDMTTMESLQFNFSTIEAATNKFSIHNKLGEGGFGEVYKGILSSGQEIAVKRLSQSSAQGSEEFKNEVVVVAKLQHRHLVRLLGFCLEGEEKILVYEYVPNKSLDYILFDPERQRELDWTRRYKIIAGIARGIQYLHEDSRLRIIHRDLKASNVLLDGNMNSKISDFGMARIFGVDQTRGNTSHIVGTYGYMSPEYAMHGEFSIKSDVYSFGVLLMEIISGKKNSSFYQTGGAEDLLSYAWKLWNDGAPLEMLDPTLRETYIPNEVMRCIHIGLLCVQEDPLDRPTMATILLMLDSYSVTLPAPKQPAFFLHSSGIDPNMLKELKFGQFTANSTPLSVNEASISEIIPR